MGNIMIASPAAGDSAIHSSVSAIAATLPLGNLKTTSISQPARFLTPSGCQITVDLGVSPSPVNLVALLAHNATATGTCRVRSADSEANLVSDPSYDSGILRLRSNVYSPLFDDSKSLPSKNSFIHVPPEAVTDRWWRFDMSDAALPYLDVGRLYLSDAFIPGINIGYAPQEGVVDSSKITRTVSGLDMPLRRQKRRYVNLALEVLNNEEAFSELLLKIDLSRGITEDVLFIMDYEDLDMIQLRSVYGRMAEIGEIRNTSFEIFAKTYRIEEIIA